MISMIVAFRYDDPPLRLPPSFTNQNIVKVNVLLATRDLSEIITSIIKFSVAVAYDNL